MPVGVEVQGEAELIVLARELRNMPDESEIELSCRPHLKEPAPQPDGTSGNGRQLLLFKRRSRPPLATTFQGSEEGANFVRAIGIAICLSLPLWAAIIWVIEQIAGE